jgi:hypothetical protein
MGMREKGFSILYHDSLIKEELDLRYTEVVGFYLVAAVAVADAFDSERSLFSTHHLRPIQKEIVSLEKNKRRAFAVG